MGHGSGRVSKQGSGFRTGVGVGLRCWVGFWDGVEVGFQGSGSGFGIGVGVGVGVKFWDGVEVEFRDPDQGQLSMPRSGSGFGIEV